MNNAYSYNTFSEGNSGLYSSQEEQERKEELQKRHYFLLSELQNMCAELPAKFQQRLPYDLLSSLARSLLDSTLFDIVNGLREIQQMTEKNLLHRRMMLLNQHKVEKQELLKKHRDAQLTFQSSGTGKHDVLDTVIRAQQVEIQALVKKQQEEMTRHDMKTIMELDQQVSDQQVTLEKAGVQGFCVTNNPNEIRIQMYLLGFIQRLYLLDKP